MRVPTRTSNRPSSLVKESKSTGSIKGKHKERSSLGKTGCKRFALLTVGSILVLFGQRSPSMDSLTQTTTYRRTDLEDSRITTHGTGLMQVAAKYGGGTASTKEQRSNNTVASNGDVVLQGNTPLLEGESPEASSSMSNITRPTIILHVGPQKMGTTFLQCFLMQSTNTLNQDACVYMGTGANCGRNQFDFGIPSDLFHKAGNKTVLQPSFAKALSDACRNGQNAIIVSEYLKRL